jgi:hypothetical protein
MHCGTDSVKEEKRERTSEKYAVLVVAINLVK